MKSTSKNSRQQQNIEVHYIAISSERYPRSNDIRTFFQNKTHYFYFENQNQVLMKNSKEIYCYQINDNKLISPPNKIHVLDYFQRFSIEGGTGGLFQQTNKISLNQFRGNIECCIFEESEEIFQINLDGIFDFHYPLNEIKMFDRYYIQFGRHQFKFFRRIDKKLILFYKIRQDWLKNIKIIENITILESQNWIRFMKKQNNNVKIIRKFYRLDVEVLLDISKQGLFLIFDRKDCTYNLVGFSNMRKKVVFDGNQLYFTYINQLDIFLIQEKSKQDIQNQNSIMIDSQISVIYFDYVIESIKYSPSKGLLIFHDNQYII